MHSGLKAAGPRREQMGASGQLIPNQDEEIIFGVTSLLLCVVGNSSYKRAFSCRLLASHIS